MRSAIQKYLRKISMICTETDLDINIVKQFNFHVNRFMKVLALSVFMYFRGVRNFGC